jgi:hypothetical protein
MDGSALLQTVSFLAVIVMILLMVWVVLLLESGGPPSRPNQGAANPDDQSAQVTAPERKAA